MVKPKKEQMPLDELRMQVDRLESMYEGMEYLSDGEEVVRKCLDDAEHKLQVAESEMLRFFAA